MLKKEICKKCWEKSDIVKWEIKTGVFTEVWTEKQEKAWDIEGIADCPTEYLGKGDNDRKITDQPPTKCPYYLENII